MANVQIVSVAAHEAGLLSDLAQQAYFDHFSYLWTDGGMQYVSTTFAVNQLRSELTDDKVRYLIAQQDGQAVGYMKLNLSALLNNEVGVELHRVYILASAAGQGTGKQLIRYS